MAAPTTPELTLVIGGTGKTGRRVVERLTRRHLAVRVGSRSAGVPFDWHDKATWGPALAGVDAAYITYVPDLAVPGSAEVVGDLARTAVAQGTRRLVLLSGRGEDEAEAAEHAVAASGADWTVLRCAWFNQNLTEGYLLDPVIGGELALPADTVREPFIDADDIADVATAVLTEDGHAGRTYDLTGPRLLTFAEAVADINAATGRDVTYTPIPLEAFTAGLAAEGVPADIVWLLGYLFTTVLDGRNESLTDDVAQVLGRPPRDFADWARAAAATGVWGATAVGT